MDIQSRKEKAILRCLASPIVDLWALREFALSDGGLLNDSIRQRAWPMLVGLYSTPRLSIRRNHFPPPMRHPGANLSFPDRRQDDPHAPTVCLDETTITMDVNRCTWHLLTGNQRIQSVQTQKHNNQHNNQHYNQQHHSSNSKISRRQKRISKLVRKKQTKLGQLIAQTLVQSYTHTASGQKLRYYQGYHDIACIVLSVLGGSGLVGPWQNNGTLTLQRRRHATSSSSLPSPGMDLASAVLLQISETHLREYLREDFHSLQTILGLSTYPLLALWDRPVHDHLLAAGMSPCMNLPWIITWFAHDLRDTQLVKRIFDFFLVSHPLMPLYLSLAMILHPYNRHCILNTEIDLGCLHQTLASLPRHSSSFGWKYHPSTGGYVSYDEDDETVPTSHTSGREEDDNDDNNNDGNDNEDNDAWPKSTMDCNTHNSGLGTINDVLEWQADCELVEHHHSGTPASSPVLLDAGSTVSSLEGSMTEDASSPCKVKVPIQELLDQAVAYMHILPPRQIMSLATRYHGPAAVNAMLKESSSDRQDNSDKKKNNNNNIPSVLESDLPALSWRFMPCAVGFNSSSISSSPPSPCLASDMLQQDADIIRRRIHEMAHSKSVIASGFGASRREERTRRRCRKRFVAALVLTVIVVGVTLSFLEKPHAYKMPSSWFPSWSSSSNGAPFDVARHPTIPSSSLILLLTLLVMTVGGYYYNSYKKRYYYC